MLMINRSSRLITSIIPLETRNAYDPNYTTGCNPVIIATGDTI